MIFKGGLKVHKKLLESFLFKKATEKKQAISTEENNLLIEVIFLVLPH